jgi:hypothetical protein
VKGAGLGRGPSLQSRPEGGLGCGPGSAPFPFCNGGKGVATWVEVERSLGGDDGEGEVDLFT